MVQLSISVVTLETMALMAMGMAMAMNSRVRALLLAWCGARCSREPGRPVPTRKWRNIRYSSPIREPMVTPIMAAAAA